MLVQEYSSEEIVLSNKQIIKGSCVLTDSGEVIPIELQESAEEFLSSEHNYKFLENFKNKEIFLVGCGENFILPSMKIRKLVHESGFKLEWGTTRGALNIFNLLVEDSRDCFALLI
ncbi:MAG: MTH938/NDUFAF3 family protein [Alphaproteobacteria bacterium]|nr:MTH938/NDUFAF3 family protein [Alphaproteobacteria bacterium]